MLLKGERPVQASFAAVQGRGLLPRTLVGMEASVASLPATLSSRGVKWQALLAAADAATCGAGGSLPDTGITRSAEPSRSAKRAPFPLPPLRRMDMKRCTDVKRPAGARAPLLVVPPAVDEHSPFCKPAHVLLQQPASPASSSSVGPVALSNGSPNSSAGLRTTACDNPRLHPTHSPAAGGMGAAVSAAGAHGALGRIAPGGDVLGTLLCLLRKEAARQLLQALRLRELRLAAAAQAVRQPASELP